MSNIVPGVTLTELCFPDITGKTIKAWGSVAFGYGLNYTTGGIPFGLVNFADARTVDFNGFLKCEVIDENVQAQDASHTVFTFFYVPSTDKLQIFSQTSSTDLAELTNGAVIPTYLLTDASIIFQATWNRTTVLG
jgi:hypothetical protein